jgi:hypothetical protein
MYVMCGIQHRNNQEEAEEEEGEERFCLLTKDQSRSSSPTRCVRRRVGAVGGWWGFNFLVLWLLSLAFRFNNDETHGTFYTLFPMTMRRRKDTYNFLHTLSKLLLQNFFSPF